MANSPDPPDLAAEITAWIRQAVAAAGTVTDYRAPLAGFADAADPRFGELRQVVNAAHMLPEDLLPGARTVVSFFLPFAPWVVKANARHRSHVAREWAVAYVETNALIGRISAGLARVLGERGIRAAAEPATHNFDPVTLVSRWSHKSVGVIAGLGSLGLHQMVITDAGCAGRFGSLVMDAPLAIDRPLPRERCLHLAGGSCRECEARCPVGAIEAGRPLDKQRCYRRLQAVTHEHAEVGLADVCGKCALGPCSLEPAA